MHGVATEEASHAYLVARLDLLRRQVRAAVELRRSADLEPDDPFRGLYISNKQAAQLLGAPPGTGRGNVRLRRTGVVARALGGNGNFDSPPRGRRGVRAVRPGCSRCSSWRSAPTSTPDSRGPTGICTMT